MNIKGTIDFAVIAIRDDEYKAFLARFPVESKHVGPNRTYLISRLALSSPVDVT